MSRDRRKLYFGARTAGDVGCRETTAGSGGGDNRTLRGIFGPDARASPAHPREQPEPPHRRWREGHEGVVGTPIT